MQKRKSNVLLFGLVVVAISGMAVWNAVQKPAGAPTANDPAGEEVKEKNVSEQDRAKAAKELVSALPKVDKQTKMPTGKHAVMPDQPGSSMTLAMEPTIILPKYSRYSPKPNDSTTATHWYDEKSRSAMLSEENKKGLR